MSDKGISLSPDVSIGDIAVKLEQRGYQILKPNNDMLVLRPTLGKRLQSMFNAFKGNYWSIKEIILINKDESIYVEIKWNNFHIFIGFLFLFFFIDGFRDFEYMEYIKFIVVLFFMFSFMIWIAKILTKRAVKIDIKESMAK